MNIAPSPLPEPPADCALCPRLADLRTELQATHPDWFNAPVPALGDPDAWLAVIGLAPGLQGANRTGRAFTGDGSGKLLFQIMTEHDLAEGNYKGRADDDMVLKGSIIINSVRCVPPQNRPTPEEIRTCRSWLEPALGALPHLRVVVALGQIAHQSAIKALGGKLPKCRFVHGAEHVLPSGIVVIDSYHCSRYNQNIGRLTHNMLNDVFVQALARRP